MIRVGIAGIGFMGMIHYHAYQKVRGAKVTAICEIDPKRLAGDWRSIKGNYGPAGTKMDLGGIARYDHLDELIADPDIDLIDVCLPPGLHADTTTAALGAGKHVFCEKPIALSTADADRMVKAAAKAGKLLSIGHVLPFFSQYQFAYRTAMDGQYGRVLGGYFKRVISDPLWISGYYDPAVFGGPAIDLHIHDAHFIRLLFGMPKGVQSVGRMRGEVAEYFNTQFHFDDPDLVVAATCGVINQQGRPFTHGFEIHFEKATLIYDDLAALGVSQDPGRPVTVLTDDGKVKRPKLRLGDEIVAFAAEINEVVTAVTTGTPSSMLDGTLARDALLLSHKQTESIRRGRVVKIVR